MNASKWNLTPMCALHYPPLLSVQQPGLEKARSGDENFWKALLPPTTAPHPPANSSRNLILKGERAAKPGPAMSCPQIQLAALGVTLDWPFSTSVSRFAGSRFFILVILKSIKWFLKKKKKKRHLNKSKKRKDDCSDTLTKFYHPFILLAKIYRMLPHVRCWDYSCKWS